MLKHSWSQRTPRPLSHVDRGKQKVQAKPILSKQISRIFQPSRLSAEDKGLSMGFCVASCRKLSLLLFRNSVASRLALLLPDIRFTFPRS